MLEEALQCSFVEHDIMISTKNIDTLLRGSEAHLHPTSALNPQSSIKVATSQ